MKRMSSISLLVMALTGCDQIGKTETQAEVVALDTQDQRISYLLGMDNARGVQSTGIVIDVAAYQKGFADSLANAQPQLSEAETAEVIQAFQAQMIAKREEMQKAEQDAHELQAEANLKQGAAFLEANAAKEGIVTTESGLQYRVIKQGAGALPALDNIVEVHYAGRLLDDTEFDSSIKRGAPVKFGVTQVIPGWTEALQLMAEGSKWELYIPAELAYGAGGQGPIGPNAVLIFEVELLNADVKKIEES